MKTKTIEVVETQRGLPGAKRKHPGKSTSEVWKHAEEPVFEITRLTNTVEFGVGDRLEREQVEALCAEDGYKVVVTKKKES